MKNQSDRTKSDNKQIIKKVLMWIIQIAIIVVVTYFIPNQYLAIAIAIVLGIVASKILSLIIRDTDAGQNLENSDPNEKLVKDVIQKWTFMPDFLRDKLIGLEKGQIQNEVGKIGLRKYRDIVQQYLKAMNAIEADQIDQAKTLLDYIKVISESEYPEIFAEVSYIRNTL